jgi:hypothetical protein
LLSRENSIQKRIKENRERNNEKGKGHCALGPSA